MSDFIKKNWNPEKFSSFKCYFDYLDDNTVSFHFQNERIVLALVSGKIQIKEFRLDKTSPNPELISISNFFSESV